MPRKISLLFTDISRFLDKIENSVDERVASAVGYTVRYRMLELISKGISPILGYGRFPEYKAATRNKVARKGVQFLNREIKKVRSQLQAGRVSTSSSALGRLRSKQNKLKTLKSVAQGKLKGGYPYNTKEFKAGQKFVRPVNLFLTGAFLQSLSFAIGRRGKKMILTVGYFDGKQAIKEKGHREGAGGQPKRPTLPKGNEKWAQTIQLDIMKLLRDAISTAFRNAKGK